MHARKDEDDWGSVSSAVFLYLMKNRGAMDCISQGFLQRVESLQRQALCLGEHDGPMIHAVAKFDRYCKLYTETVACGECVPYTIKEVMARELERELSGSSDSDDVMAPFCQPDQISFTRREEKDLMLRVLRIKEDVRCREDVLSEHLKEYAWIPYDYDGLGWAHDDVCKRCEVLERLSTEEVQERLSVIDNEELQRKNRKELVRHDRSLSRRGLQCLDVLDWSVSMMDVKKEMLTRVHYMTKPFFERLAAELQVERKYTSYVMPYELQEVLKGGRDLLCKRWEGSSVYIDENGCRLLDHAEVCLLDVDVCHQKNEKKVSGLCACPGIVKGHVRVVKSSVDLEAFQEGEILVTTMTTMNYLEVMKKAAAIVTDDGGIICHAAIVSRETKTPTIVGTKCASSVFTDGDYIIVNATDGVASERGVG